MIPTRFAILLLCSPFVGSDPSAQSPVRDTEKRASDQTTREQVRASISQHPEVAEAARHDLLELPPGSVPHLEGYLRDPTARRVVIEVIESICERAIGRLGEVGDAAPPATVRQGLEEDLVRAWPSSASSLERAIRFGKGARQEVAKRIWADLAGSPPADDGAWTRLRDTIPLSLPALRALVDSEESRGRASQILEEQAKREIALLSSEDYRTREDAFEILLRFGDSAEPALREVSASGDPHLAHIVGRALRQIRWQISTALVRRIGNRLDGYEAQDWRSKRATIYRLERLGKEESIPTLRRILEVEASAAVRIFAAESMARLGDPLGILYLERVGVPERFRTPQVTVGVYMGQGIRYLGEEEYEKAVAEFRKILEIDPENDVAYYNLACAYSLSGDADQAFECLRFAIEKGFDDFDHMEKDEDLDPLRDDPRYEDLLKRHRPPGETPSR